MWKKATCLVLGAGLAFVGVPGAAEVFGLNTVWGSVPRGASDAANAVLVDAAGKTRLMVPIIDGTFAFRDVAPGQYTVALPGSTRDLARSLPVDLAAGSAIEAVFGRGGEPAAVVTSRATPPAAGGGPSRTGWILVGAAAKGFTTTVVAANTGTVASPSR